MKGWVALAAICSVLIITGASVAQEKKSSYSPVVIKEPLAKTLTRMNAAKPEVMKRQMDLLNQRYDLSNRLAKDVMMSGGIKAVHEGGRAKHPGGMTWEKLANMTPEEIRKKAFGPKAAFPCPIQITPKAAWSSRSSISIRSKIKRAGTSQDLIWTTSCRIISCPSSLYPSI